MKALILGLSLALASPLSAAAHDPSTARAAASSQLSPEAAAAAEVVDRFHEALRRGDTAAALELLAPEVLIYEEGGAERSRTEYASHHLAADAAFAAAVPSTRSLRTGRAVGDMAWVATESRTTGRYRDRAVDRLSAETMVLRRERGRWRIVHVHWSSRAPAAS